MAKNNTLFDLVPEARAYYDFDKNKDVEAASLKVASDKKVWWKCPDCGAETCQPIHSKTRKLSDGTYRFRPCKCHHLTKREKFCPQQTVSNTDCLSRIWDPSYNPALDPETLSVNSKIHANWICKKCSHRWCASVRMVYRVSGRCPACEGRSIIVPGSNDVLSLVPAAKRYYDWSKNNDIDIEHLGVGSNTEVWWCCPNCGEKIKMAIKNKIRKQSDGSYRVSRCNKCYGKSRKKQAKTDTVPRFVAESENLMRFWDFGANKGLDPATVGIYSKKVVSWKCQKCGYTWSSVVNNLRNSKGECPCCDQRRVVVAGINDVFTLVPEAKDYYDFEKNADIDITTVNISSKRRVWWKCPTCETEAFVSFAAKIKKKDGVYHFSTCKMCHQSNGSAQKNLVHEFLDVGPQSLSERRPDIARLWSANNRRQVTTVTPDSLFDAIWDCPDCHYEYRALVCDMVNGNVSCPICNNKRIQPGYNTLADKNPNIAKLWSFSNYLRPTDVFPTSPFTARWSCPNCGGEYDAPVKDMVNGTAECPYCSDKKILPGLNSFAVRHPILLKEWNYVHNYIIGINPDAISDKNESTAWWICEHGHKYTMRVNRRILFEKRHKIACPICKGRRREARHFV